MHCRGEGKRCGVSPVIGGDLLCCLQVSSEASLHPDCVLQCQRPPQDPQAAGKYTRYHGTQFSVQSLHLPLYRRREQRR